MLNMERARIIGKRLRFVPVAVALCVLAAMSSSTAFATTASISPGYRSACYSTTVNFTTSWSGDAPFMVEFDTGDPGGNGFGWASHSRTIWWSTGYYPEPNTYQASLYVADLGCSSLCGTAEDYSTIVVNEGGVGGCPLGPAYLDPKDKDSD